MYLASQMTVMIISEWNEDIVIFIKRCGLFLKRNSNLTLIMMLILIISGQLKYCHQHHLCQVVIAQHEVKANLTDP